MQSFTPDIYYYIGTAVMLAVECVVSLTIYLIYRMKIRVFKGHEVLSRVVSDYERRYLEEDPAENLVLFQF